MSKIAIDVVLLPSPEMMAEVIEMNVALLRAFDHKIVLDTEKRLPHITLCMGVLDEKDIPEAEKILRRIADNFSAFELVAKNIKADIIPTGKKVSGLVIENTETLQKLHEMIMQGLRRLLTYEVDASMLYTPPEIEPVTFTWIRGYETKHKSPTLFHPHITVGFGETDKFKFPIDFTADTLALCQLGNYCTCRKVVTSFELIP